MHRNLSVVAVAACACFIIGSDAFAGTFHTITIDDLYGDWAGVPILDSDGGDNVGGPDIGDTQICNDEDYLYIRNTFPNSLTLSTFIALDIDSNPATGFDVLGLGLVGAEAAWQNDFGFAQADGVFNAGALGGDFFGGGHALLAPFGNFPNRELAISLDAIIAGSNLPLFPDDTFTILIWTDGGETDFSAVITYTLAVPGPSALCLLAVAGGMRGRRRRTVV
jgi:hypothetical protein